MSLPPASNRIRPDHLPTPFSAADIQAGCPAGRTIRLRSDAPGEEPTFRRIRFVEVDTDGAVQEIGPTDEEGNALADPSRHRSSWGELQQHASQPASETVVDEVDLALPSGTEACWRYTVGGSEQRATFWFAKGRPGMPVQVEQRAGGELVSRSVVISDDVM
jgi:hypothetical protein